MEGWLDERRLIETCLDENASPASHLYARMKVEIMSPFLQGINRIPKRCPKHSEHEGSGSSVGINLSKVSYFHSWFRDKGWSDLTTGDKSQIESSIINSCRGNEIYKSLKKYLGKLCHPLFQLYTKEEQVSVTPASVVTASELAINMGLPKKSVAGVPVNFSVYV